MTDARAELQHLATLATQQGRVKIAAICVLALATLDELEAELLIIHGQRQKAGQARADHLTPARRQEIARGAAKSRWLRRRAS